MEERAEENELLATAFEGEKKRKILKKENCPLGPGTSSLRATRKKFKKRSKEMMVKVKENIFFFKYLYRLIYFHIYLFNIKIIIPIFLEFK